MSFAFKIKEQRWENLDSDMPTIIITTFAKVFEVSAVNNPAYQETDINARDKNALDNAKAALDSARSNESDDLGAEEWRKEKIRLLRLKISGGF